MDAKSFVIGVSLGESGVAAQCVAVARELLSRGHRVAIVSPRPLSKLPEDLKAQILSWPSPRPTKLADGKFALNLLSNLRPSCVLANFGSVNWLITASWCRRIPLRVAWYHTLSSQISLDQQAYPMSPTASAFSRIRKSLVYRLATHLVPVSAAAQKDLVETYNVPPAKCHVILNAMEDPGLFRKLPTTSNIVCSARFDPCKGQDVLIEAFARIAPRFPDAKLELLGAGKCEADCRELARALGVSDRCFFRGAVPRHIAIDAMAQAMTFVLPSRMDNCPLALIEAMAVGAPVVATNVGGIPEMVRDGLDGLLVPPDDALALSEKLASLLSDVALRQQFGERAWQRFSSTFELTSAARRQVDWLEALLRAQGANWGRANDSR